MRIHLKLSKNNTSVDFHYISKITGTVHKWLKRNELHDSLSLYSFSFFKGGIKKDNYLQFPTGTSFFFSSYDDIVIKNIIKGIQIDPSVAYGMEVNEVIIQENPDFSNKELFYLGSPVLIKRNINGKDKHYIYTDNEAGMLMVETIKRKLKQAGLCDETLSIEFDKTYSNPKTKLIHYNNVGNKASMCPVIIKGNPETKLFAWNVGVGNSTGIGFGSLI